MRLPRRTLLSGAVALVSCDRACGDAEAPSRRKPDAATGAWKALSFPPSDHYDRPEKATVLLEGDGPVLVALHGRGEAGRGLEVGARGWRDDYHLDRAHGRLSSPPLTKADFLGLVEPERLANLNASLEAHPYRGICTACPYTPALSDRSVEGAQPFASFVTDDLLPKVRSALGVKQGKNGIDGVSMGGRLSLFVGLTHPEAFGAVGAMQPAIGEEDIGRLVSLAKKAGSELRLVTSTDDYFREAVEALSKALTAAKVAHQLIVTPGPHDYVWNRGPGCYEMLLWHERVLRGLPAP